MKSITTRLLDIIDTHHSAMKEMNHTIAAIQPAPGRWSKNQILGHLIDSAQNNLRRFIVAQYEEHPKIVYQQDDWVRINDYQNWNLDELGELWYLLNKQIANVLSRIDETGAERICITGEIHSLRWLAEDYIKHLEHHLHQVLELEDVPYP